MNKGINLICILAAAMSHLVVGGLVLAASRVMVEVLAGARSELPALTRMAIAYTSSGTSTIVTVILVILTGAILLLTLRSERLRFLFPLLLTASFSVSFLILAGMIMAIILPFARITSQLGG